ncbi:MAG: AAA family ATPase [Candidatus Cloacimonetes bacterium]|nr:AAA family ATPase [Candidatus Cloacimonadota bacterium]
MKILLVGAHGTGKTTLAKEIVKRYKDLWLIDNIHREAKRDGFKINKTNDIVSQIETVRRYLEKVGARNSFISTDNIIRQTAYALCNKLPEPIISLMKELCYIEREHFANKVFYVPIEFPLEKDGVRNKGIKYQKEIDVEIQDLLNTYYWNMYYTITGSVNQRTNEILKVSGLKKLKDF